MSDDEHDILGQGLRYEDSMPLQWHPLAERPAEAEALSLNEANEEVLRFIDALDEYPIESGDEHAPLSQDLARVETKLNLLLGLVGQLLTVHFPLPSVRRVTLSPKGIQWPADTRLQPGAHGWVEIYLNVRCPRPLRLPGRIERVVATADGFLTWVQFEALSESLQDHLEKIIFRHHRRRVALARRRPSSDLDSTH